MRKFIIIFLFFGYGLSLFAQTQIYIHNSGSVIYSEQINQIDSIKFSGQNSIFNALNGVYTFPINNIDSITFGEIPAPTDSIVYIVYEETYVTVVNPLENSGVSIITQGCDVTINATSSIQNLQYILSGSTGNGSLTMSSDKRFSFVFNGVNITSTTGPAIKVAIDKTVTVVLNDNTTNSLTDAGSSIEKAAFHSKGQIIFTGNGTLNVTGNAKHAINSDDYIIVESGTINVLNAVTDGIHCDYFVMQSGTLNITANGDGIDGSEGYIQIDEGNITINTPSEDCKSIKCDSIITVNGGNITLVVSGNQSKGFKSDQDITFNGGTIDITISGTAVLESSGNGYDPSYCSGIKTDMNFMMNDGNLSITAPSSNKGGKGISADAGIIINGGIIEITTAGNGATYTNSNNQADSYTSACIKSDGPISLLAGDITCSSSGTGGKGINTEGILTIGITGSNDFDLILNVTTSGERITVSGGGGGPGGGGGNYANPKAIKSQGNLTINSGTITVNCTQSSNEGGECIESKATLTINGGVVSCYSKKDDCINAASNITINGGTIFCQSDGNDGIDSNGTLFINGGFTISRGARSPEEGFDCDNNQFKITGGIALGTGGATSNPTSNVCTQRSIKYIGTVGQAICISNPSNEVIMICQLPTFTGGGGGGGGGNRMVVLFTSPDIIQGSGWTLKYGGTISGGTEEHGYYTGATYSGGSTKTFNVTNMVTTVQ